MNDRNFGYKEMKRQADELQGKKKSVSRHFAYALLDGLAIAALCTGLICFGIWLTN